MTRSGSADQDIFDILNYVEGRLRQEEGMRNQMAAAVRRKDERAMRKVARVLWKAVNSSRSEAPPAIRRPQSLGTTRPRVSGPDDDPDFLRQLDEKVKRRDDPPAV